MKKVTVVMPVFNGEKYLEESLQSVLRQTWPNIEFILVDGGSTDGTLAIAKRYRDRLAAFISEPDNGMYDAINKGIRRATGDFVTYVNSDDLFLPDTVETAVRYFEAHPETSMLFGDCEYIDGAGRYLHTYRFPPFDWKGFVSMNWMSLPQPTLFWRRELQEKHGLFDSTYRMAGDFEFFSRIARNARVSHVGKTMARFRLHSESLSAKGLQTNNREVQRMRASLGLKKGPSDFLNRWSREIRIKTLNLPLMLKKALRWKR